MIAPPRAPSHDENEALIREARARQRRRRLLSAAGVAIAAATGFGVYGLVGGGGQRATTGGSPSAAPPLCRSSQFSATASLSGATGTMDGAAMLTNTSDATCSLPRTRPRVTISWHGIQMPVRQKRMSGVGATLVHVLAPGAKAFVHMDWYDWCGKPSAGTVISPTLRLRFGSLRVTASAHVMTPPRCNTPGTGTRRSTILVSRALSS